MPGLTYEKAVATKGRLLALTGLEKNEFQALLPTFKIALEEHLNHFTIDGQERIGRDFVDYKNALLPTPEDKLLFILVFIKQNLIQEVMGALFDMSQPKANDWLQILVIVLRNTLRFLGDAPCRAIEDLKFEIDKEDSPLFVWTLRNVPFLDPSMKLSNVPTTVERKNVT
jgi:Helix-turn-helix of DDE superfamily endonuclease